jgi:biopolymer transport protein ExbD
MRKLSLGMDRKSEGVELNMSPLIDMIFILLIFFLVTTTFVKESGVEVNRPIAASSEAKEETNLVIGVTQEGAVWIEGSQIDMRSVRSRMERFKHENPDGNVVITADKDSFFGDAIEVLDQVRLANIRNVVVAATKE